MLAVNVSINSRPDIRLPGAVPIAATTNPERERPTILYTKSSCRYLPSKFQNWLPWQRPLDPRSRLCLHWIAWSRKHTPRITPPKLYRFKVYLPHPISQEITRSQRWVGDPLRVWYGRPHIAADWTYYFRFPDFHRTREWRCSKCRFWVRKSAKIGGSSPVKF